MMAGTSQHSLLKRPEVCLLLRVVRHMIVRCEAPKLGCAGLVEDGKAEEEFMLGEHGRRRQHSQAKRQGTPQRNSII